jgi:hypothetical protein
MKVRYYYCEKCGAFDVEHEIKKEVLKNCVRCERPVVEIRKREIKEITHQNRYWNKLLLSHPNS